MAGCYGRVAMAGCYGRLLWQGCYGRLLWQVAMAGCYHRLLWYVAIVGGLTSLGQVYYEGLFTKLFLKIQNLENISGGMAQVVELLV